MDRTYETFSRDPGYVAANARFVAGLPFDGARRILDLACGTGTMAALERAACPGATVVGLDRDRGALSLARRHVGDGFACVRGSADVLPVATASVDAVVMGNSIHMVPDTDALLVEVRRVLRPGGLFAFNSCFYAGTFPSGTERFYHEWMRAALAFVTARDRMLRAAGKPGIRRQRGTVSRAFAERWRTPAEWGETLARHRFAVETMAEATVVMTRSSFEAIGAYHGFASVLLAGYPVEVACEALVASVAPALAEVGAAELPRGWLEVVGRVGGDVD